MIEKMYFTIRGNESIDPLAENIFESALKGIDVAGYQLCITKHLAINKHTYSVGTMRNFLL